MTRDTLPEIYRDMAANAGYCTPPGPAACAWQLAEATREAQARGWWLALEPDPISADDNASDVRMGYSEPGGPYYGAMLMEPPPDGYPGAPRVLESLWGIDAEPGDPYYRVIFAELASQALDTTDGRIDR